MSTPTHFSDCTLTQVREAHTRIRDKIHRTPVMTSETLDTRAGAHLFFKCENLQKIGAFKARGAANAVFSLSDDAAKRGVATHSSGNHAAALARAARLRGIPSYIVKKRVRHSSIHTTTWMSLPGKAPRRWNYSKTSHRST
jgi:threonine dehydratase